MKRKTEDLFKGEEVIHRKTNMALSRRLADLDCGLGTSTLISHFPCCK